MSLFQVSLTDTGRITHISSNLDDIWIVPSLTQQVALSCQHTSLSLTLSQPLQYKAQRRIGVDLTADDFRVFDKI